jgi:phosphoribosyl 1,2-cyclic phosphodiesterase
MRRIGEDAMNLDAVLITHEHVDHVGGLYGLVSRYQVPVYCTARTQLALQQALDRSCGVCRPVEHEALTMIGTITILPVPVSHDALDPMAYIVVANGKRAMFATDLGYIGSDIEMFSRDLDFLYLESNHDIDGLRLSCYPAQTKVRVSENHLSNDQVCTFIADHGSPSLHRLVLGHLSAGNNDPRLVHAMAQQSLRQRGLATNLHVLASGQQSEVFTY